MIFKSYMYNYLFGEMWSDSESGVSDLVLLGMVCKTNLLVKFWINK